MIKLKAIKLQNYRGYKDFELDLRDGEGVKKWAMFYGPNGIGKSNLIRAVELLASPRRLIGRLDNRLFLRKLTYHPNYNPTYIGFDARRTNLYMEAIFLTGDGDKRVVLENNWDDKIGLTTNELPANLISAADCIDADKPINMLSFQLNSEYKDDFINIAEAVYNFKCYLPKASFVREYDSETKKHIDFYTDFIITKYNDTLVHYKSFSDGEKKIATLIVNFFRRVGEKTDILLVDNIEMHIYFKRHMTLIKKIEEIFPHIQIIAATHSPAIVSEMDKKYLHNLEQYVG